MDFVLRREELDNCQQRQSDKKNTLERRAIMSSGVAAFFFTSAQITSTEQ